MPELLTPVDRMLRLPAGRHLAAFASLSAAAQAEAILSFLSVVVLVRYSGTVEAGQAFLAQALAGIWFMVLDPRLDDAAQRYVPMCDPVFDGQGSALFRRLIRLDLAAGLAAALVGIGLAEVAGSIGDVNGTRPQFVVLTLVAGGASAASGTAAAGFALTGQLRRLGLIRLAAITLIFPVTTAATITAGPTGYLVASILGNVALTTALVVLAGRAVRAAFGPPTNSRPLPGGLVGFAVKSSAATSVALGSDIVLLALAGLLGGPSLVTLIKIAIAPGRLLLSLVSPVTAQMYPRMAAAVAAGDLSAVRHDAVRVTGLLAGTGLFAGGVAYLCLGTAIRIVFGSAYGFLAPTAVVLFVAACLRGTVVWSKVLPLALGRPGVRLGLVAADSALMVLALVTAIRYTERSVDAVLAFAWGSVGIAAVGVATWLILLQQLVGRARQRSPS